jgi:ATP-dependent Clp protease adaptor protein ClpS
MRSPIVKKPSRGRYLRPVGPTPPFSDAAMPLYCQHSVRAIDSTRKDRALTYRPAVMTDRKDGSGAETGVVTKTRTRTQRPPMYKVLLLNDDYTPMEFVVHVLERFFGMSHAQAFELMLTVHKKGLAVVGVFSFEVAETKVAQVMDFARRHQHPLQCTMEKE